MFEGVGLGWVGGGRVFIYILYLFTTALLSYLFCVFPFSDTELLAFCLFWERVLQTIICIVAFPHLNSDDNNLRPCKPHDRARYLRPTSRHSAIIVLGK